MNKEQQKDKSKEMRTNLEAAVQDIEVLISHFDHPSMNPALLQVLQRAKGHIESAAAQLDGIPGVSKRQ